MNYLPTAFSSHKTCFICRQKNTSLHVVKKQDIIHAFVNHRIFIKDHARFCNAHLNENGLIRKAEFSKIPTKNLPHKLECIKMYDNLASKYSSIFDSFKDVQFLENDHCKKVTGWTKDQFLRFSSFITSILDSKNRNKYQLIALYRYWLRTGIEQKSLAYLFGNNTSQQNMSDYLKQIRTAIYKDFVPYFLGVNNAREFYLKFSTVQTQKLFNLDEEHLVIIADGTYSKIQKSSNNDFQYKTYSKQKNDSLLKPFILCCADGYIIDCYGPFQANNNDATILNYILENDHNLMKILIPHKTLFLLDRGFRDSIQYLKSKSFITKIPTCTQLESENEKQLTIEQTSESRLVTKCRYVVEKKIGQIKKHLALDHRHNNEIGRLPIDYRIACAMLNFLHKPCYTDGEKADIICQRLKSRCKIKRNILESLLKIRSSTAALPISILEVTDFPKLSRKTMVEKLFFGKYYIRLCKSYLSDFIKNGFCKELNNLFVDSLNINNSIKLKLNAKNTKIIYMEIISRHRRSLKPAVASSEDNFIKKFRSNYKVFIQYIPHSNKSKSILAYICSCKSGKRQAGCCIHVATCIYYFSFAKYIEYRAPAEYLSKVLVNMADKDEPNKPLYVRNKRFKKTETDSIVSESETSESTTDINLSDDESNNVADNVEEIDGNQSNSSDIHTQNTDLMLDLQMIENHVPKWGAFIKYKDQNKVFVSNTCTIDYFLFALWLMNKKSKEIMAKFPINGLVVTLIKIVDYIEDLKWDEAREQWITNIMKYDQEPLNNTISLFGSNYDMFIQYLIINQNHNIKQLCKENCPYTDKVVFKDRDLLFFTKNNNRVQVLSFLKKRCDLCKNQITVRYQFNHQPYFLFVESRDKILIDEIPKKIEINNLVYTLLCTTLHIPSSKHFVGIFQINSERYVLDDLVNTIQKLPESNTTQLRTRKSGSNFYTLFTVASMYLLEKTD